MSPLKAIRNKCLDCMGYQPSHVKECGAGNCALHPFRMGRDPFRKKRDLTEEQRETLVDRMLKARESLNKDGE